MNEDELQKLLNGRLSPSAKSIDESGTEPDPSDELWRVVSIGQNKRRVDGEVVIDLPRQPA